jgi:hypothetical protein
LLAPVRARACRCSRPSVCARHGPQLPCLPLVEEKEVVVVFMLLFPQVSLLAPPLSGPASPCSCCSPADQPWPLPTLPAQFVYLSDT